MYGMITKAQGLKANIRDGEFGSAIVNSVNLASDASSLMAYNKIGISSGIISKPPATSTVFGNDPVTQLNASRLIPEQGIHQVLLHGTPSGLVGITPRKLATTMLQNGFQRGTPIRLISCWTGVWGDGAAYQLSRYLKSPVSAPTNKVRVLQGGAYEILGGGRFRTFSNTTIQ
jgi:hypothetical protein